MNSSLKYMGSTVVELLSSCKHRRFKQALKWFELLLLLVPDILIQGLTSKRKKRVECSLCSWIGREFMHFYSGSGGKIRENAICPKCRSLDRQRRMAEFLIFSEYFSRVPLTALYIAPHGAVYKWLNDHGVKVITVDLESPSAMVAMDLHHLAFKKHTFDLIICCHVLEHVRDDMRCIRELHRVLKPGQIALLPVPLDYMLDKTIEWAIPDPNRHGHVRSYGKDYVSRLEEAGFHLLPHGESIIAVGRNH